MILDPKIVGCGGLNGLMFRALDYMFEVKSQKSVSLSEPGWKSGWLIPAIYGLGLLVSLGIFHNVLVARSHSFLCNWDASVQSYAWHVANVDAVRSGTIRLWDFTTSSGTSFIGELQTAPLYPLTWMFALVPDPHNPDWLELLIILHYAIAFGSFVLLLRHNAVSMLASVCGALCFAFGGAVASRASGQPNIFEGLVYLPLVVFLCQKSIESSVLPWRNPWVGLAGVGTSLMVLAGHIQPAVHAGFAVLLLVVFSTGRDIPLLARRLLTLSAIGLVTAIITAPQIFALDEYLAHAYRWIGAPEPTSPPHRIPYSVYGFDYVVSWADLSSLWNGRESGKDGATLFVTKIGLFFCVLGLGMLNKNIVRYALCLTVISFLIAMGDGSLLGKIAYHVPLIGAIREPSRILCLFHLGACLLLGVGVDFLLRRIDSRWQILWSVWVLIAGGLAYELSGFTSQFILPRTMPMYPANYYSKDWSEELQRLTLETPNGPYRYMALPSELLPPNFGNTSGALGARGHRATMQIAYRGFLDRNWDPAGDIFRRLGVRYIVSREPVPGFQLLKEKDGLKLWERSDALGVFHFENGPQVQAASVEEVHWSMNSVRVKLGEHPAARLVFAQIAYPGWRVSVSGRPAALVEQDGLMAVDLEAGKSEVTFSYHPRWFLFLSVLSLGMVALVAFMLIKDYNRK